MNIVSNMIFILIFTFFSNINASEIDMRPLGMNISIQREDSFQSKTFFEGNELCRLLGMELPSAKELLQIWCHADLPLTIDKKRRRECQIIGISNTVPNFYPQDVDTLDYWSSTPDDIARNWARGVDFTRGVYFITNGSHLGHIRCIKRF
jgi:hypothetical protein